MARYIEADKVIEAIKNYGYGAIEDGYKMLDPVDDIVMICGIIDYIPTADVAPRAELDRVARELERVEALYFAKDTQLENAKAEVAREICCEIEEEIVSALESNYRALKEWDDGRCNDYILEMVNRIKGKIDALRGMEAFVEELKKKYTEGEK